MDFHFTGELWRWTSRPTFHTFVTVPEDIEDNILSIAGDLLNGWNSVRVDADIGGSSFRTSVFPSPEAGRYILPVKKTVRDSEILAVGDIVDVRLRLVDF
jgi:hypothetical protein